MEIVGLRGEKVRLVPVDRSRYFDSALRWMNDPEVTRYLNLSTGVTPGMEEEWFQRVQKRDTDFAWAIHTSGTIIGDKEAWGHGYASGAMRVRTKFAFETFNLHRVESQALAENEASQRALEKAGYTREGVFRKRAWIEGRWHDTIRYAILDEDYFADR